MDLLPTPPNPQRGVPVTAPIMPGAEPFSRDGGAAGALVLHGFTGNPQSMRPVAEALAQAGFTVDLPLLPGHGTAVEDMIPTRWDDWLGCAEDAYQSLWARCDSVVTVGLSMGGALAATLAVDHPELAGLVCINAIITAPDGLGDLLTAMLEQGDEVMGGIGSDIADPDASEAAYAQTPLRPLQSLLEAAEGFPERLTAVRCPVLVMTSPEDHTVPPTNSDLLAASVSGQVERVSLDRSYHVATLDYDRDLVVEQTVAFAQRVSKA
jgi:carboxylesterase